MIRVIVDSFCHLKEVLIIISFLILTLYISLNHFRSKVCEHQNNGIKEVGKIFLIVLEFNKILNPFFLHFKYFNETRLFPNNYFLVG